MRISSWPTKIFLSAVLMIICISATAISQDIELVGSYATPHYARNVAVSDSLCYVANDSAGLLILNVSNPFSPTLIGSYDTPGSSWGIFAADLNGDGAIDMAVANTDSNGVCELWNEPIVPAAVYISGDINNDPDHFANGVDVLYAGNYLKQIGPPPAIDCYPACPDTLHNPFYCAGDVNGNCQFNGVDVTYFVNYLKQIGSPLLYCPVCQSGMQSPPGPTFRRGRPPANHKAIQQIKELRITP